MRTRENVQVYVYSIEEKKVLMLKRIPEKAGYWQPVCGGVEKNETNMAAAVRELYEETGIEAKSELIELPFEFKYQEPKDDEMMHMKDICFVMTIERPVDVRFIS